MRAALAANGGRSFSTSAVAPKPKTAATPVAASTSTSAAVTSTSATRGYASIAEDKDLPKGIKLSPTGTVGESAVGVSEKETEQARVFYGGRPTNALGFAKHVVTSAIPKDAFQYEEFYQTELDKKHKDKSYRVRFFHLSGLLFRMCAALTIW